VANVSGGLRAGSGEIDTIAIRYYTGAMSMGKRKRDRQPTMGGATHLPTAASHPFCRRLNELLAEHGFDNVVEAECAGFYAETMGRLNALTLCTVCTRIGV
jgi:hypothetical protein